jgi:hypothetical protein
VAILAENSCALSLPLKPLTVHGRVRELRHSLRSFLAPILISMVVAVDYFSALATRSPPPIGCPPRHKNTASQPLFFLCKMSSTWTADHFPPTPTPLPTTSAAASPTSLGAPPSAGGTPSLICFIASLWVVQTPIVAHQTLPATNRSADRDGPHVHQAAMELFTCQL